MPRRQPHAQRPRAAKRSASAGTTAGLLLTFTLTPLANAPAGHADLLGAVVDAVTETTDAATAVIGTGELADFGLQLTDDGLAATTTAATTEALESLYQGLSDVLAGGVDGLTADIPVLDVIDQSLSETMGAAEQVPFGAPALFADLGDVTGADTTLGDGGGDWMFGDDVVNAAAAAPATGASLAALAPLATAGLMPAMMGGMIGMSMIMGPAMSGMASQARATTPAPMMEPASTVDAQQPAPAAEMP